jgi:hypothetical protein
MMGSVFPRPHRWAVDKHGRRVKAPVRKGERYEVDGTEVVAPNASSWSWQLTIGSRKRGNRRTISRGGYKTRKLAEAALAEAVAPHGRGDKRPLMPAPTRRSANTWTSGWRPARCVSGAR